MRASLFFSAAAVALLGAAAAQALPNSGSIAGSASGAGSGSIAGSSGFGAAVTSSSAGNHSVGGSNVSSGNDASGFFQGISNGGVHNNVNTYSGSGGGTTSTVITAGGGHGGRVQFRLGGEGTEGQADGDGGAASDGIRGSIWSVVLGAVPGGCWRSALTGIEGASRSLVRFSWV